MEPLEIIRDHVARYFVARYGTDYVYRAPELYYNLGETWTRCDRPEHDPIHRRGGHMIDPELARAHGVGQYDRCICGPDSTGEAPDERPDCPQHGTLAFPPCEVGTDE